MSATHFCFRRRQLLSSTFLASWHRKLLPFSLSTFVVLFSNNSFAACPVNISTTVSGPCSVSNSGMTITSSGTLNNGSGSYAIDQTGPAGAVTNNGIIISNRNINGSISAIRNQANTISTITNLGSITTNNTLGFASAISNALTFGVLNNSGTISASATNGAAGFFNSNTVTTITNSAGGTISGTGTVSGQGMGIQTSGPTTITTITNNGTIFTTVRLSG